MPFVAPAPFPARSHRHGLRVALAVVMAICGCMRQSSGLPPVLPPVPPPVLPMTQDCGAGRLSHMSGKHFSSLADAHLPGALRVLHPLQAITPDFSPTRLNARVTETGMIRTLHCG